ncbi:MAG TPA: type II toxin-antitoxin system PemK/MazF family toxin [Solirubrobacterales bacterium]|jgi:mRNA interferase MazF|nr:type II toxin-antitoxin system PemK/MazF family toxin [Solirubrobacterales bacterium]
MDSTSPRRGEIWLASLGAARKGEPGKNGPVVVFSVDGILTGENHELIVIVPLSSSLPPSRLRPEISPETGIDKPSIVICRGIRGVARTRLLRRVGEVDDETMAEIERALGLVLAIA